MSILKKTIFLLIGWCAFSAIAMATDYQRLTDDIRQRLDKTSQFYQQQQIAEARTEVQMAYFEVFENLEGPIRINISAQKSYQMEAAFGEIRKMIGEGKPQADVDAKINWLKGELDSVLPVLKDGHKLSAEQQHGTYDNSDIAPYWQQSFKTIDDLLAEAITLYQNGNYAEARRKVQQAQYDGFKNSEMEMSVRQNRSSQQAGDINRQFNELINISGEADRMNDVSYRITTLLQDLEDLLPGLPITREEQQAVAAADTVADSVPDADWSKVVTDIDAAVKAALAQYKGGDGKGAMMAIQDAYFDLFEASGMENKIGSRDAAFKTQIENHFTRMVSQIKAGQPIESVEQQSQALQTDLMAAVEMLGSGAQTSWSLLIYSLLIIVREGLEALLIVAAIVAYLVKNNHQDKLPLIRQSVYVALLASVVTAVIFQWLFSNSGASRELLEGVTMLIAVVMLFSMSYWLLSKVEAKHWKAYLEGKLSNSLSTGSIVGLWLTSFLAVYREGAETVLFYFALMGDSTSVSGHLSILAGFLIGCVILLIAYVVMRFSVVKLPLKPFFMFTGCFMYLMAFVFAGKGVLELIEGKLFQPTLIAGMPEIVWLGVYPYVETLIPQAALIVAALIALWVMKNNSSRKAINN
ncbi:iron permease [Leminorella grimontii]|uniref:Iron permease n=1 Tax=Leminorella grimontii TaxID=82981 RepID=A0AAV5MXL0_9GAMM|nr:FTR1 family protein [Leminorella grimontii]KFC96234.1 putative high-affinity iron permease [Leminorella grimontii ATCC 33999 = DSM 5078]GKX54576.1 iron permease [Leminorella grimontii]VFS58892.1 Ferrous iron uptake protein [Leminorella grimontii]